MEKSKKDYFDIGIKILACSNLSTQSKHFSTQICVRVANEKRYSKVVRHTNKPFFDDYFVFTKFINVVELMDTLVTISAFHVRRGVRVRKLIGCTSLDLATVWHNPGRQLKKWFVLSLPSDRSIQKKAFVECDLKVTVSSEYVNFPRMLGFETMNMIGSKRSRYKVLIYHCIGLQVAKKDKKVLVRVSYAGNSGSTTRRRLGELVEWNEQIVFVEIYPPTRQNLTLEIRDRKKLIAIKRFNLIDFYKIYHSGFLKMFGPTYIHLYAENDLYRGSLLVSLESELLGQLHSTEHIDSVRRESIEPISEIKYGIKRKFICYLIIFDLMITKANCIRDNIYISLEMGNSTVVESQMFSAIPMGKFLYVPFQEKKPCISLSCEWPDSTHRLHNSNLLASLANHLRAKLNYSYILASKGCEDEARRMLLSECQILENKCNKVSRLLSKGTTELDAKRTAFLREKVNILATSLITEVDIESVTELCKLFLDILDSCSEDNQDSLPLLIIHLRQGQTNVGSCSLHPRQLIFSDVKEKRGENSTKINNLLLKGRDGEIVARMDVWLWLGKRDQLSKCKELFPPGYKSYTLPQASMDQISLPASLIYPSAHMYNAIFYIHSGYIDKEVTNEGECDTYLNISFFDHCKQTTTAKRTLAPTWKETLIFPGIKLYTSPKYLVENPPSFLVQLWSETSNQLKMIGFGLVGSNVRFQKHTSIPEFPLKWWNIGHHCKVLAACEFYTSKSDFGDVHSMRQDCDIIPRYPDPPTMSYRLEVMFWGLRPSYARALKYIVQPQIYIQIGTVTLSSDIIARANTTFNFKRDIRVVSITLPMNKVYSPPLIVKIMSNLKYFTSISEKDIYRYEFQLPKKSQWEAIFSARQTNDRMTGITLHGSQHVAFPDLIPITELNNKRQSPIDAIIEIPGRLKSMMSDFSLLSKIFPPGTSDMDSGEGSSEDDELEQDWWDRYWNNDMKVYNSTLENQEEFSGLTDVLSTFTIKQRKVNVDYSTEIGKLKAIIILYKWPEDESVVTIQGQDPQMGILKLSEHNSRVNILVRVYCVKATDLYPSDLNGKSDPYIEISTPTKTISDKINRILSELNPVFGKYFEITATLPIDSVVAVRVMDWDALSSDDVIGETIIDIENRFYSKHRATCGLPETYSTSGPDAWRDIEMPSEILERLCNNHNLPLPQYNDKSVLIGTKEFEISKATLNKENNKERLALKALNCWNEMPIVGRPLVREHVETRSLFREDYPGLIRGKIEMWVDMFDMSQGAIPLPIDISPRLPQGFELRVTILNTVNIPLVDQTLGDRRCTDIMVSGWLGDPKQSQKTDVHHNSYTGEGNFNWRFVFPFLYYRKEKQIVSFQKNLFDIGTTEIKVPAMLHLEVHDSEGLLENSFIGGMMWELSRMPRGAHSIRACKPDNIFDPSNYVDLFKVEKLHGWWPFLVDKVAMKDRGYLEAEFLLITAEEARKCPVGLGRSPPDPLPIPSRSRGIKSPWRILEDMIAKYNCNLYLGLTFHAFIILSLIILIGVLIYILPSAINKLTPQ